MRSAASASGDNVCASAPPNSKRRHLFRRGRRALAVDSRRHLVREGALRLAPLGMLGDRRVERFDVRVLQQREIPQVFPGVAIVDVDEELKELIWRGQRGVEPDGARFRLAEFRSRRRRDERRRDRMRVERRRAANQFDARRDVAPLVAAAHLQPNVVAPAKLEEIVRLQQHVRELGVRDAGVHAALHRVLLQHVVDREMLAHVAHEVDRAQTREPLRVVDEPSRVACR